MIDHNASQPPPIANHRSAFAARSFVSKITRPAMKAPKGRAALSRPRRSSAGVSDIVAVGAVCVNIAATDQAGCEGVMPGRNNA